MMQNYFVYGYGFNCDCEEDKLINFIKNHRKVLEQSDYETELLEELFDEIEEVDLEDLFIDYECDNSSDEGVGAVIANIISRETGIRFSYYVSCEEYGTLNSIVLEEKLPWQLSEKEKFLTKDEVQSICKKYMNELCIEGNPEYLQLEYFG